MTAKSVFSVLTVPLHSRFTYPTAYLTYPLRCLVGSQSQHVQEGALDLPKTCSLLSLSGIIPSARVLEVIPDSSFSSSYSSNRLESLSPTYISMHPPLSISIATFVMEATIPSRCGLLHQHPDWSLCQTLATLHCFLLGATYNII